MKKLAIGLMAGTSGDGVSVVLASFGEHSFQLIDYKTFPYPQKIFQKIRKPFSLKAPEISQLNFQLGEFFAPCVLEILKKNRISPQRVSVIGSHGQTIFHAPEVNPASTLQIGESAVIAERTGIPVVSDFRVRDIACGGEGAPLIPFFDHFFWGQGPIRAFQNIGGIANVTVVGENIKNPIAFDTGPGNCLIDWCVQKISKGKKKFDAEGKMALPGKVNLKMVQEMETHPYFKRKPPKSTGRELFNEEFLSASFKKLLAKNPADALSTLTYFTASTIAESYKKFVPTSLSEVVVSGGGAFNKTLMSYLQNLMDPVPVCSIEKFGIHPQAKEPLAFAFFALRAICGKSNHLPSGTGAQKIALLGKITPGKNFRGLR